MIIALCFYTFVAVYGNLFSPRKEIFPFFSWSLFSDVPSIKGSYELVIHQVNDVKFEEPVSFYELNDYFQAARRRAPGIAKSVRSLGRALHRGIGNVEEKRAVFEDLLRESHLIVEYEIQRVRFRPLERWQSGELVLKESLGKFLIEVQN